MKKSPSAKYQKWKWMAPLGLILIGAGLSLTGEGIIMKYENPDSWQWIGMGTLALVVFNSGIAIVSEAVKRSLWAEWEAKYEENTDKT